MKRAQLFRRDNVFLTYKGPKNTLIPADSKLYPRSKHKYYKVVAMVYSESTYMYIYKIILELNHTAGFSSFLEHVLHYWKYYILYQTATTCSASFTLHDVACDS